MKIAFFTPNYPPEIGACSARIAHLAQYLHSQGHEVEIFTALPNYPKGRIFEAYKNKFFYREEIKNIKIFRYWIFSTHSPKLFLRGLHALSMSLSLFFSYAELRRFRPDWILVQSPPLFLAVTAFCLKKLLSCGLMLNISDLFPHLLKDLGKDKQTLAYRFFERIEKFLYKRSDICIGQSQEIINHIGLINPKAKSILYRTGVDCEVFLPKKNYTFQKFRIVYAGLLGLAQGVLELCQNLDFEHLDIELHIYGEGFEGILLQEWLKKNPSPYIFLHGAISQEQIAQVLPEFDAALVLQKRRILGTVPSKIYEAMAVGLPVLLVGSGESAEIVRQSGAGLVSLPQNYADLAQNIFLLKNFSATKRQEIGKKAREAALQFFDRKKQLRAFTDFLAQL